MSDAINNALNFGFMPKKENTAIEFYRERWNWFIEEFVSLNNEIPEEFLTEYNALSVLFSHTEKSVEEILERFKVDVNSDVPPPEIVLSICDPDGHRKRMIMTKQNISCITAQAKVGKTFLVKLIISSLLNKSIFQNRLLGEIERTGKILYIDTEQSKYHVKLGISQIQSMLGLNAPEISRLDVYQFDAVTTLERKEFTKWLIYNRKYEVVILDGISDLALDSNNLQESDELVRDLRVWATENNCHIVNIIHLNPSETNTKMKGHLGTKLMDKSEIVIGVSIDKENESNRIVQSLASRNRKPDPFEFTILDNGIPEIIQEDVPLHKITGKKAQKTEKPDSQLYKMLTVIFSKKTGIVNYYRYGELKEQIVLEYEKMFSESLGETNAKKLFTKFMDKGWILKTGEVKFSSYFLGEFSKNLDNDFTISDNPFE